MDESKRGVVVVDLDVPCGNTLFDHLLAGDVVEIHSGLPLSGADDDRVFAILPPFDEWPTVVGLFDAVGHVGGAEADPHLDLRGRGPERRQLMDQGLGD